MLAERGSLSACSYGTPYGGYSGYGHRYVGGYYSGRAPYGYTHRSANGHGYQGRYGFGYRRGYGYWHGHGYRHGNGYRHRKGYRHRYGYRR